MNNPDVPKWEIISGKQTVIVCAEKRLTYDCKRGWEKAFRKEVQDALRVLTANENEMLIGKYGSVNGDMIDTENAVYYNFAAPVSQSACYGVSFKTLSSDDMYAVFDILGKQIYNYLYIYNVEPITPAPSEESVVQPFAVWKDIPINTMRVESADYYFMAMRGHPECFMLCGRGQIDGDFGLNIRIRSPEKEPFRLTSLMKPLLDGIVSSFHKLPENTSLDDLTDMSIGLLYSEDKWKRLLLDERNAVLPPYQYVRQYRRDRLQWSPMDDRCKEARITIEYGAEKWNFSGEIYEVSVCS